MSYLGTRGGLSLGLKGELSVSLRIYSINHIDVDIKEDEGGEKWRLTSFYGALEARGRNGAWDLLKRLGRELINPCLVCRDFNEIHFSFEKEGGLPREEGRMEEFRAILEDCHLEDIGYTGRWFMWERGNLLEMNTKEHRGVVNLE